MPETRSVVEPAKIVYNGGHVRTTWSRIVEESVRHWGWTTFFGLIAIGGLVGGYFIDGIKGVGFSIVVEATNLFVARRAVRRSVRVERVTT